MASMRIGLRAPIAFLVISFPLGSLLSTAGCTPAPVVEAEPDLVSLPVDAAFMPDAAVLHHDLGPFEAGPLNDLSMIRDLVPGPDASLENIACEMKLGADWSAKPPTTGLGPKASAQSYEMVIGKLMSDFKIPGGAVSVTKNGKLVLARAYGFADTAELQPAHPDNLFRVASLSKQITAAAVLKLVEAGLLNLDDKAFPIIADLKPLQGKMMNPQLANITVRNLLNHTGGWNRDFEAVGDPMFQSPKIAAAVGVPGPASCSDIIRYMLDKAPTYAPGSTMCYSNFGYCVLGRIIERKAAMMPVPYADYVKQNVLGPVGATHMGIGRTLAPLRADNEVRYYDYPGAPLATSVFPMMMGMVPWPYGGWNLEAMDSHGAWIASPVELLRYQVGVDGLAAPADILMPASEMQMFANPKVPSCTPNGGTTPTDPNYWYGFGWQVNSQNNHWHTGALSGTATEDVTASNGFSWAAFFNSQPQNAGAFYTRLDQDLWTAFNGVQMAAWTKDDYFDQYQTFSAWIPAADYPAEYDHEMVLNRYPVRVEGRLVNGEFEYRAQWAPLRNTFKVQSAVGLDCLGYRQMQAQMDTMNYNLVNLQSFKDGAGRRVFQATWGLYN